MNMPVIVAEMGASHMGSLERVMRIVGAAKESGADAVKLQTWSAMTVCDRRLESGPWAGARLTELYERCKTPWDWHAGIFRECARLAIDCFSTPFDEASVDFLETLGCPAYKIASFEITHSRLIRHAASTGKPMILSTGMASEDEIDAAVDVAMTAGAGGITLLRCVSAYPAPVDEYHVITMAHMRERFETPVGLSDHTAGSVAAVVATALGASVIEKHLSIDRLGPDGGFAAMPDEFAAMVRDVRAAAAAVGGVRYGPSVAESASFELRRSLWITRDMVAGEELTAENMAILRPAGGLAPQHFESMLGQRVSRTCARGTPLSIDLIK